MYNYLESIKNDIIENFGDDIREGLKTDGRERTFEKVENDCWISDSVTGNASGSYTFNSYRAKDNLWGNEELIEEAVNEFCIDAETVAKEFLSGSWEYWDVTIRCYLLPQALELAIDEIEEEMQEEEAEEQEEEEVPAAFIDAIRRDGTASSAG